MSVNEAAQPRRAGKGQGNSARCATPVAEGEAPPPLPAHPRSPPPHAQGTGAAQVWQGGGEGRGAPCVQSGTCAPDFKRKMSMVYVNYIKFLINQKNEVGAVDWTAGGCNITE